MAQQAIEPCFFLALPLEIRHKIYGFSSQRRYPKLILKEYLEKTDPSVGPPQAPPAPAPIAQAQFAEDEGLEDEEQESEDDDAIEGQDEDVEMSDADADADEEEDTANIAGTVAATTAQVPTVAANNNDEAEDEAEAEDENGGDEEGEDNEDGGVAEGENDEGDDEDEDGDEAEDDGNVIAPPPALRERSYGRQTKYRHMLKTIRIRGCPPPIGLLQANKQLNQEATEYHRNTSVMQIDITKNFAHQSFFLETLDKFTANAFSPVEQVRKVSITITWDSEWLRTKSSPPNVELESSWAFEWYFNERIQKTIELFRGAPELRHIVIEWHDTERTSISETLMNETYIKFLELTDKHWDDNSTDPPTQKNLDVTLHEHISDAGATHAANSVLALRRTEFDQILTSEPFFR